MITCLVKLPNQPQFIISFVYASTDKDERIALWSEILSLSQSSYSRYPWTLLGDLNQVLNPYEDSISYGFRVTKGMCGLRSCLLSSGLSDLSHRGSKFTWWNNIVAAPIAKKLDRILVNDEWLTQFPLSIGFFGEYEFSDHSSGNIILSSSSIKKTKLFKFQNFLLQNAIFLSSLQLVWTSTIIGGTDMFSLSKKLKLAKACIRTFSKMHFSEIEKKSSRSS